MDVAPPFSMPWSCNGRPALNSPPLQSAVTHPIIHSSNGSHEGANYHHRPPFPAAPPPSRPYKRAPALWWSTSALHLASFPPQSCPRHGPLEPKLRRWCAASSPSRPSRRHPRGKPPWPGAATRPSSDERGHRPPWSPRWNRGPATPAQSTNSWTWSTGFSLQKQFLEIPISGILHLGPSTFSISTHSP
jgi:hypothetical protein